MASSTPSITRMGDCSVGGSAGGTMRSCPTRRFSPGTFGASSTTRAAKSQRSYGTSWKCGFFQSSCSVVPCLILTQPPIASVNASCRMKRERGDAFHPIGRLGRAAPKKPSSEPNFPESPGKRASIDRGRYRRRPPFQSKSFNGRVWMSGSSPRPADGNSGCN